MSLSALGKGSVASRFRRFVEDVVAPYDFLFFFLLFFSGRMRRYQVWKLLSRNRRSAVSVTKGSEERVPAVRLDSRFGSEAVRRWPRGYRPLEGVAPFLEPEGVELVVLAEVRKVLLAGGVQKDSLEGGHRLLARDLSVDSLLWMQCAFDEHVLHMDGRRHRLLMRLSRRDRLPAYSEVCETFCLPTLGPPAVSSSCGSDVGAGSMEDIIGRLARETECAHYGRVVSENTLVADGNTGPFQLPTDVDGLTNRSTPYQSMRAGVAQRLARDEQQAAQVWCKGGGFLFRSTPYSLTQERAVAVASTASRMSTVRFASLPELRNLLYADFNSCSPLKHWARAVGDVLILTREFVAELALYLARRVEEEIPAYERVMQKRGTPVSKSHVYCVLCPFGNGRLGHFLNQSGLLPDNVEVVTAHIDRAAGLSKAPSSIREAKDTQGSTTASARVNPMRTTESNSGARGHSVVQTMIDRHKLPPTYNVGFPIVDGTRTPLGDLLDAYRPIIVVAEPHTSRDYSADLRGFYSVRELLMVGQVDSPAMGSFSFPWLTFGVGPGSDTYWIYNDRFEIDNRLGPQAGQLPVDPPYIAQGYKRVTLDRLSATVIHSNDTAELPHQGKALSFRRCDA